MNPKFIFNYLQLRQKWRPLYVTAGTGSGDNRKRRTPRARPL
jgi:hypothetical protein